MPRTVSAVINSVEESPSAALRISCIVHIPVVNPLRQRRYRARTGQVALVWSCNGQ